MAKRKRTSRTDSSGESSRQPTRTLRRHPQARHKSSPSSPNHIDHQGDLARALDASLGEVYLFCAESLQFLYVNQRAVQSLGFTSHELSEMTPLEIQPDVTRDTFTAMIAPLRSGEQERLTFTTVHQRRDRSQYPVEVHLHASTLNAQPVYIASAVDISDRQRAERALRDSEVRYRSLYEQNPTMYFTVCADGIIWSVNRFGAEYLGYDAGELIGRSVLTVIHQDDRDRVLAQLSQAFKSPGQVMNWEFRKVTKAGQVIWVKEAVRSVVDSTEKPVLLIICDDITERKRSEEALRASEQAIRELCQITSSKHDSFETRVRSLLDLGRRRFRLPIGLFTQVQDDKLNLVIVQSSVRLQEGSTIPLCESYCSEVLASDAPLAFDQAGSSPWRHHAAYASLGFEAYLGTRLMVHDKPYGTICFLSPAPAPARFTEADKGFLRLMAQWMSAELERQQADADLRDSEDRFRRMFEEAPIGMCILNRDKTLRKVNRAFRLLVGYEEEEIIGQTYAPYTHPDDLANNVDLSDRLLRKELSSYSLEKRYIRKDGRQIWVNVTASPLTFPSEGERLILAIVEDITDRKEAEESLRRSEELLGSIVNNTTAVIYVKDIDGRYRLINRRFEELFGVSQERIQGKTDQDIFPHEIADAFRANDVKVVEAGRALESEEYAPHADGLHTYISIKFPLFDHTGGTYATCGISTDITERKRAEQALRASEEELRHLLDERERISQDLHDSTLQSLYAVGMNLEATQLLSKNMSRKALRHLGHSMGQLNQVIQDVRRFIPRLGIHHERHVTLSEEISTLVDSMTSARPTLIRKEIDSGISSLMSPARKVHLLNITREAMSNILRHAEATSGLVRLRQRRHQIRLVIRDDGKGFDTSAATSGMGLRNMAARAKTLGAQFALRSTPGGGTSICVTWHEEGPRS